MHASGSIGEFSCILFLRNSLPPNFDSVHSVIFVEAELYRRKKTERMPTSAVTDSGLKELVEYDLSPEDVAERLTGLGLEVESIDNRYEELNDFIVGEVVTKEKHEKADKLSVCTVSTGSGEPLTVVCGASNVEAGQKIAFAPVGTEISGAGFTVEKRKIRGVVSEGMICSESELGLGEGHDGILVLPKELEPGTPLSEVFGDVVYEIDITPNRGDCLSHIGVSREIAAITGNRIRFPESTPEETDELTSDTVEVEIEDPDLCPRYAARVVKNVKVEPSPLWLQEALKKIGVRPINNVVDVASYVMFESGHPLHAFDYDQVSGKKIVVRTAEKGEKFTTLDSKERELPEDALLICDAKRPVAIAGVMGGENSEITDSSTNVLIESAWFDPSSIRKTARGLGLATDASYRFERGADIGIVEYAINRAARFIAKIAGGEVLKGIIDAYPVPKEERKVPLRFHRTASILGLEIEHERQIGILEALGCKVVKREQDGATFLVPTWRTDITQEIDLIEEIARVNGYGAIPDDTRAMIGIFVGVDPVQELIGRTRQFFVANGFTEVVAPYQTDPESAQQYGEAVELRNALGEDTSFMRTNLLPGLGKIISLNERHSRRNLRLFEIGKAFRSAGQSEGIIPGIVEMEELALVVAGKAGPFAWDVKEREVDLYDLRGVVDRYLGSLGLGSGEYRPVNQAKWGIGVPALALFVNNQEVARLGSIDDWVLKRYDIASQPYVMLLDMERLSKAKKGTSQYVPPSKYPVVDRDISILLDASVHSGDVEAMIQKRGGELLQEMQLFDIYQGKGIPKGKKSISYGLKFGSKEKTLEEAHVDEQLKQILKGLMEEFKAELRS